MSWEIEVDTSSNRPFSYHAKAPAENLEVKLFLHKECNIMKSTMSTLVGISFFFLFFSPICSGGYHKTNWKYIIFCQCFISVNTLRVMCSQIKHPSAQPWVVSCFGNAPLLWYYPTLKIKYPILMYNYRCNKIEKI